MTKVTYITWSGPTRTMEATFNEPPNTEEIGVALAGMMIGQGWSPEEVCFWILNHINDGREMQELPMVQGYEDAGFHGSIPG